MRAIWVVASSGLRVGNEGSALGTAWITGIPSAEAGCWACLDAATQSGLDAGDLADAGRWRRGRGVPQKRVSAGVGGGSCRPFRRLDEAGRWPVEREPA